MVHVDTALIHLKAFIVETSVGDPVRILHFLSKCVETMPAKYNFNTKVKQKNIFFRLKMMRLWKSYKKNYEKKSTKKGVGI